MKKLLIFTLSAYLIPLANAQKADWQPLNDSMYLDKNSILVSSPPKQVSASMYIEVKEYKTKFLSRLTVDCKNQSFYLDDIIYKYDSDFSLIGGLKNTESQSTKQSPKKITNEAVPSVLLTLCDDSKNLEYRETENAKKLKYDRNSIGQMYKFIQRDEWLIFHWVMNNREEIKTGICKPTSQAEKKACVVVDGLVENYSSLNFIPDDYRYQNNPNGNIKQLALDGKLSELKKYKLYSTWSQVIFKQAENNYKSDKMLPKIYALLLFYEDVIGRVKGGITN